MAQLGSDTRAKEARWLAPGRGLREGVDPKGPAEPVRKPAQGDGNGEGPGEGRQEGLALPPWHRQGSLPGFPSEHSYCI